MSLAQFKSRSCRALLMGNNSTNTNTSGLTARKDGHSKKKAMRKTLSDESSTTQSTMELSMADDSKKSTSSRRSHFRRHQQGSQRSIVLNSSQSQLIANLWSSHSSLPIGSTPGQQQQRRHHNQHHPRRSNNQIPSKPTSTIHKTKAPSSGSVQQDGLGALVRHIESKQEFLMKKKGATSQFLTAPDGVYLRVDENGRPVVEEREDAVPIRVGCPNQGHEEAPLVDMVIEVPAKANKHRRQPRQAVVTTTPVRDQGDKKERRTNKPNQARAPERPQDDGPLDDEVTVGIEEYRKTPVTYRANNTIYKKVEPKASPAPQQPPQHRSQLMDRVVQDDSSSNLKKEEPTSSAHQNIRDLASKLTATNKKAQKPRKEERLLPKAVVEEFAEKTEKAVVSDPNCGTNTHQNVRDMASRLARVRQKAIC